MSKGRTSRWLFLLRSFFPKWVFFDDVAPELRLEVSYGPDSSSLCEWINALEPIPRSVSNLVVNPHGNYLHACHNHLNHFNSDLAAFDGKKNVEELVTYKITRNLALFQIKGTRPFVYKFRLRVVGDRQSDVVLTSPSYEAT